MWRLDMGEWVTLLHWTIALDYCTVILHCCIALLYCTVILHCYITLFYCTGLLHWTIALDYCTGLLHWTIALDYCTGLLHWTIALFYCTVLLHCTIALYYCSGLLHWTIAPHFIIAMLRSLPPRNIRYLKWPNVKTGHGRVGNTKQSPRVNCQHNPASPLSCQHHWHSNPVEWPVLSLQIWVGIQRIRLSQFRDNPSIMVPGRVVQRRKASTRHGSVGQSIVQAG